MLELTDSQIITALLYCRCDDPKLCMDCPYRNVTGEACWKQLHADASRRIMELTEERDELKRRLGVIFGDT